MKKVLTLLILIVTLIIPQLGCNSQVNNPGIGKSSYHLNTICAVTIYSMDGVSDLNESEQQKKVLQLITEAFALCDDYEKILSKIIEDSDIYRINHAGGQGVEVESATIEVINKGLEYSRLSEGAFDITIGKVSDLWNFQEMDDKGNRVGVIPEADVISEAMSHVDYNAVVVEGNTIRLTDPAAELDLGGIAKGYIADKVAEFLEAKGVTSAVVDLGGNIVVIGEKGETLSNPVGTEFKVGIADPNSEGLLGLLACKDKTVVTSGTYERYFELDGKRYHHVLDTKTGYPVESDLVSATVICADPTDADALSTCCLVLGLNEASELINNMEGVEAVFITRDGELHFSSGIYAEDGYYRL
jgi:thiamine biosynthesis lipoprotein